jgi:hypothetical protein
LSSLSKMNEDVYVQALEDKVGLPFPVGRRRGILTRDMDAPLRLDLRGLLAYPLECERVKISLLPDQLSHDLL